MAKPKGTPNKPKDPFKELEKVKQLFIDQGLEAPEIPKPVTQKTQPVESIEFTTQSAIEADEFQCGNCGNDLDQQYAECPYCGVRLEWA